MTTTALTAYICVNNARAAIDFYTAAFGAEEDYRIDDENGRIAHAALRFGAARLMLSDAFPDFGVVAPTDADQPFTKLSLEVDDVDGVLDAAVQAGAALTRPASDQFHGMRTGAVRDPFGYEWLIGAWIEKIDPAEMRRRYRAMMSEA